ncbi:hypothetical protein [Bombilactobacillus bombi]|uniref:hypothetical protein n=1 Tax=Bombilactobacillus bombi TaxID=1303590 RepID=UPI0015E5FF4B|nr:hypothetical protein [Bombilactobacillus bombi]MBA1433858.1 hypothetical protein [Bombilactobacillus bombi]
MVNIVQGIIALAILTFRYNFNIIVGGIIYLFIIDNYFPVITANHPYIMTFIGAIIVFALDRRTVKWWGQLLKNK